MIDLRNAFTFSKISYNIIYLINKVYYEKTVENVKQKAGYKSPTWENNLCLRVGSQSRFGKNVSNKSCSV